MSARRMVGKPKGSESPVSIRLEAPLMRAVRAHAQRTGRPVSGVIRELLDMALRMQRFPGITFVEGPAGRRAHLAGIGLDVWEVVELLREYGSASKLRKHFPRLSPMAIRVAEAYAQEYREEIDAFLEANARIPEQLRRRVPWLEVVRP